MKRKFLAIAAIAAASIALSGCAGFTLPGLGGSGSSTVGDTVKAFLTDPSCAHSDELHVAIGPVSTGTMDLKRTCTGPTVAVGAVVTPAPATTP